MNAFSHIDLRPLIVDSFAGGGGASTGIERAIGRAPDVAINHNAAALALHAANHPDTLHLDSNIWDVKPREVTKGRPVGLLWASPDCKHFSKAKGGAPRDRNIRDLAWVIVDWAEQVAPDVILMENVEEFVTWGPIDDEGRVIDWLKGQTFHDWQRRLKRAGYRVQWRELRACDYGAPTIRKRFFLIARRDGRPIVWPKPTHGAPDSREVRRGRLLPWRTAADCIDWSLPCPSIFDTKEAIKARFGLQTVRPLAANTMARVARGMKRYVLDADRPFLVNLTHGARIEDADAPIRTITGAHRGEKAVVVPSITRFNGGATGQDMRDPLATVTANSFIKRPGGAAPLGMITPYLASIAHGDSGGRREYPMEDPLGTVTVGGIQHALIAPAFATFYGHLEGRKPRSGDLAEPLRTVTTENRFALIAPALSHLYTSNSAGGEGDPAKPLKTVLAGGGHHAVIAPVLTYAQHGGAVRDIAAPSHTITASKKDQNAAIIAHVMTMRNSAKPFNGADEPTHTITAGGAGLTAVAAFIARHFGQSIGHGADEPAGTVTAGGGGKSGLAAAFLAQQNTGVIGRAAHDPLSTICQTGSHQNAVAAFFAKYYGTGDGARHDEPCHTVTVRDRFSHVEAAIGAPPFGPEHEARAREVAAFLRAHDAWDDREFVTLTIGDQTFVVVDIGLRMLTPRELFNAQGFPADYVIEGVWRDDDGDWTFTDFPKDVQISCCGNSVCPPLAEALVRANCGHLMADVEEEAAHG